MPRNDAQKPRGIADAALKGAREGEEQASEQPPRDAKTVDPDQSEQNGPQGRTENNEAPLGGGTVAFPAPSAQPTRTPESSTERPAKVDVTWTSDEDDESEWRRAGGAKEPKPKK